MYVYVSEKNTCLIWPVLELYRIKLWFYNNQTLLHSVLFSRFTDKDVYSCPSFSLQYSITLLYHNIPVIGWWTFWLFPICEYNEQACYTVIYYSWWTLLTTSRAVQSTKHNEIQVIEKCLVATLKKVKKNNFDFNQILQYAIVIKIIEIFYILSSKS